MIELKPRRGLQESLEAYVSRHPGNPEARMSWRYEGMRLLGLDPARAVLDGRYQPRICDQACPTDNGPTVFEEDGPAWDEGHPCYDAMPAGHVYTPSSLHVGATWNPFIKGLVE